MDIVTLKKMKFIYNALQTGWTVRQENDLYIFKKKHKNRKEFFLDSYLETFIRDNFDFSELTPETS